MKLDTWSRCLLDPGTRCGLGHRDSGADPFCQQLGSVQSTADLGCRTLAVAGGDRAALEGDPEGVQGRAFPLMSTVHVLRG